MDLKRGIKGTGLQIPLFLFRYKFKNLNFEMKKEGFEDPSP